MPDLPVLYSYWRSSCSWRVRTALDLKKIDYVYKPIDLLKDEQKSDDFLKVNPLGKVPAFVHGGVTLFESIAIIEYLEERFPNSTPLLPRNSIDRAKVRAVALHIVAGIQPIQNISVLKVVGTEYGGEQASLAWAKRWIQDGFAKLEQQLHDTAGNYCFGDNITLADVCLYPQVYNARRYGVSIDAYPTINRIDEALAEVPAFKSSHANRQPDTPNEERLP